LRWIAKLDVSRLHPRSSRTPREGIVTTVGHPRSEPVLSAPEAPRRPRFAFVRDLNRNASHNEIGMQAVEFLGRGVDGGDDPVGTTYSERCADV
jgi:hypothetical protein